MPKRLLDFLSLYQIGRMTGRSRREAFRWARYDKEIDGRITFENIQIHDRPEQGIRLD